MNIFFETNIQKKLREYVKNNFYEQVKQIHKKNTNNY